MFSQVGNYHYAPPELIISAGYDHTIDWWCLGVLTYHFLVGTTPFSGDTNERTMENIVSSKLNWAALKLAETTVRSAGNTNTNDAENADEEVVAVSNFCYEFIKQLLVHKSSNRLGYRDSTDVINHAFLQDIDFDTLFHGDGPIKVSLTGPADTSYFS